MEEPAPGAPPAPGDDETRRRLDAYAYLSAPERLEHVAIMRVFCGTLLADLAVPDVMARLRESGGPGAGTREPGPVDAEPSVPPACSWPLFLRTGAACSEANGRQSWSGPPRAYARQYREHSSTGFHVGISLGSTAPGRARRARGRADTMMVLTAQPPPTTPIAKPSGHPPVRLSLKPAGPQSGLLDGAWWPRSRDLARELPALTDLLDSLWGRITRVTVNPTHWPLVPRRVPVNGHVVKVGWFRAEQDPHQLLALSYHVGRWDLLIVPPEADEAAAGRLMSAACDPQVARTGSALMAAEASGCLAAPAEADPPGRTQAEAWEAEGGAMAVPVGTTGGR